MTSLNVITYVSCFCPHDPTKLILSRKKSQPVIGIVMEYNIYIGVPKYTDTVQSFTIKKLDN